MVIKKNVSIKNKAKRIKLIAMDVDGVLTGGEILVFDSGEELKIWDVKDRFAFHFTKKGLPDIKYAWITGRKSNQVELRAKEIGIDFLYQNCMKKLDAVNEIIKKLGISIDEVAYIGDDLVDIPVIRNAGLGVCPNDAPDEVKEVSYHVSKRRGGKGLFREVAEMILKSQNAWQTATGEYINA